jgi:hypothetical protein
VALERIALESLTGRISTNCDVPRSCLGYVPGAVDRERRPANIAPTWRNISAGHIQYRIFGDTVAWSAEHSGRTGPAFAQITYRFSDEVAANTARLADFRRSDVPLLLIRGKSDPYLHVTVAE